MNQHDMILPNIFDSSKPHRCPIGHSNPLVCPCSTCKMAREVEASRLALRRAEARNFAPTSSLQPSKQVIKEPVLRKETPREKIERQRRERIRQSEENWAYVQANEARFAEHRAKVLADRKAAQQAYDLTEKEWNEDLKNDLKKYLEGRHTQVCILTIDDAAKCALNIWNQKKEDGETIGSEVLGILDEIHSKIDMGIGLIAAAKVSKALGGLGVTVKQYFDAKGIERVIVSSLWNDTKMHYATVNGLNIKKNHPYRITNPTIKQLGVLAEDTVNGFKKGAVLSLIISATINTNELVFNDDYHLVDWCGSMGSDLFKAMTSLTASAGIVSLFVLFGLSVPIVAGFLIFLLVDSAIGYFWDEFKIEDKLISELKELINDK
uniref:Uncharacterized protein n=3 Tax=Vibrio TaxID=662 RepID=A0A0H3ZU74_9VIBR|nr:hypothetical protein [Vibrio sp. ZF_53]AKN36063.1 hypothetical protein [Vibrio sp. ZF_53]AKN37815.1 hypothetical protein [Vibrio sp. ZF_45]AKN39830.1 hypothetical protein [Vibrio tasmaniensis]